MYYKCYVIVIYDRNDSGLFITYNKLSLSKERKLRSKSCSAWVGSGYTRKH
jgi:hypothetical protein